MRAEMNHRGFGEILARLLLCIMLVGAMAAVAIPQAHSATLLPNGEQTFVDANGVPLAGASVYFYIPNTLTPKTTWSNSGQTTPNTNPVVLDSAGRAIIYGSGVYRQILKDALGNTIWDQLTADTSSTGQSFAGTSSGSANAQILTGGTFSQTNGQVVTFIAGVTNTGATTLLINGFGPISADKDLVSGPNPLTGGEIVAGNQVTVVYDSIAGVFHLVSFPPSATPTLTSLTVTGATTLGGSVAWTGVITPTALSTSTDNWAPTGIAGASVIRASSSAAVQLTGLLAQASGAVISFENVGSFSITLVADSASSIAANQFDFGRSELVQPGQSLLLRYDPTSVGWRLWQGSTSNVLPAGMKRQTVVSGPTDSSLGTPNFLPSTSASRTLVSQNITATAPLTATAAEGFNLSGSVDVFCQTTGNLTWTSLTASTTDYLFLTVNPDGSCTTGFTTLGPIYSAGVAIANTNGQYTFDYVHYQMWLGNGTTATQVAVVFVGEAVTSSSAVTSAVEYAYQRKYHYQDTASLPATGTTVSQNCNLGIHTTLGDNSAGVTATLSVILTTANSPYPVGYSLFGMMDSPVSGITYTQQPFSDGTTVSFTVNGANGAWLYQGTILTAANGRYVLDVGTTW